MPTPVPPDRAVLLERRAPAGGGHAPIYRTLAGGADCPARFPDAGEGRAGDGNGPDRRQRRDDLLGSRDSRFGGKDRESRPAASLFALTPSGRYPIMINRT